MSDIALRNKSFGRSEEVLDQACQMFLDFVRKRDGAVVAISEHGLRGFVDTLIELKLDVLDTLGGVHWFPVDVPAEGAGSSGVTAELDNIGVLHRLSKTSLASCEEELRSLGGFNVLLCGVDSEEQFQSAIELPVENFCPSQIDDRITDASAFVVRKLDGMDAERIVPTRSGLKSVQLGIFVERITDDSVTRPRFRGMPRLGTRTEPKFVLPRPKRTFFYRIAG